MVNQAGLRHTIPNCRDNDPANTAYLVLNKELKCMRGSDSALKYVWYQPAEKIPETVPEENSHVLAVTRREVFKREVLATITRQVVSRFVFWIQTRNAGWRRIFCTSTPVKPHQAYIEFVDITDIDPRAPWLAKINLSTQRLELGPDYQNNSFSFLEFAVLHFMLRGASYSDMASMMHVSINTIRFRVKKLKNALNVDTVAGIFKEVHVNGMIHLCTVPLDLANPARTEIELYTLAD